MSTRDQIAVASLHGEALHCVHRNIPAAEAVERLREITTRPDLLAEAAGILAGTVKPDSPERPWHITGARLLVQAGADRDALPTAQQKGRSNLSRPIGWGKPEPWPDDLGQVRADILDGIEP